MTLNDILKDPNYQGLPESERRKVWHTLFDRQYGSDPNFLGLPASEQQRARDMYADRVMGSERPQVQTAEQTGYTPEKDIMLQGQEKAAQADQQRLRDNMSNITPSNYGVSFPFDKAKHALDPNRDQAQIRTSRPTRTKDEDLKQILSGGELRPDFMLTPEMAHDKAELRSIKSIEQKEMAAQYARDKRGDDIEIAKWEMETEYKNNYTELATLSVNRHSWDNESRERYASLLQKQAEIEADFPRIAMGMNEIQYKAFNLGKRFAKEHPVLAYPDAFLFGAASLATGLLNMVDPGNPFFDYITYYEQGVSSEIPTTLGHLVRGTIASVPMNIANMVAPAWLAKTLTFADITSRDIKQYYDAGTLDANAYFASVVSGAVQTEIEYWSAQGQLSEYRKIFKKSGEAAVGRKVLSDARNAVMPTMAVAARNFGKGVVFEGVEEVAQNVSDRVVKHIMLDEPMPTSKQELMEWGKELALDFAGGLLGGFLMGGGAIGVQIHQHNEVAKYIQHNANTYESIQMLQQSIDLINNAQSFNDIDTASDLLREAKAKAVKEGVEHPRLLQGFNLASSAIMASRANQVQAIKATNQELGKEISELKQKAEAIRREGFEPGFETEQGAKLYDLEYQIKTKEMEYKKGLQKIHSNKELEMMSEALDRMDIEMAQLHAASASMPYDAEYDPTTDQGKEIKAPVMMESPEAGGDAGEEGRAYREQARRDRTIGRGYN
ncbi:MAG: hypothetical protein LRZ88_06410 [Candidatus Cloacimonetes bacterium]|nr:hypothetical protein [Candidatus Cloacimonadota bacterium]